MSGNVEVVVQFCANPKVDINVRDNFGNTPLHSAARLANSMIVRILLESGADIHAKDNRLRLPSQVAKTDAIAKIIEVTVSTERVGKKGPIIFLI